MVSVPPIGTSREEDEGTNVSEVGRREDGSERYSFCVFLRRRSSNDDAIRLAINGEIRLHGVTHVRASKTLPLCCYQ